MCVSRSAEAVNLPSATPHFISTQHMQKHPNVCSYLALHLTFPTMDAKRGEARLCQEEAQAEFQTRHSRTKHLQLQEKGWEMEVRRKVHSKPSSPSACTLQNGWEINNYCKCWWISSADFQLSKVLWKTHLHSDFDELDLPNVFISRSYLKMEHFSMPLFRRLCFKWE